MEEINLKGKREKKVDGGEEKGILKDLHNSIFIGLETKILINREEVK